MPGAFSKPSRSNENICKQDGQKINAFALSTDELITFMKEQKVDESIVSNIEKMLKLGDGQEFAAGNNETLDFKDLNSKALGILKELA